MNNIPSPALGDHFLSFRDQPVRFAMHAGTPWFALPDLCAAFGLGPVRASLLRRLPDHARAVCTLDTCQGAEDFDLVTPVGAWLYGHLDNPGRSQAGAAWVRREALRLYPDADPRNPAMFITLEPDGSLPPRPMKYSGRRAEWDDLKVSDERLDAMVTRRLKHSGIDARQSILASLESAA